jgi:hypothetical protein
MMQAAHTTIPTNLSSPAIISSIKTSDVYFSLIAVGVA